MRSSVQFLGFNPKSCAQAWSLELAAIHPERMPEISSWPFRFPRVLHRDAVAFIKGRMADTRPDLSQNGVVKPQIQRTHRRSMATTQRVPAGFRSIRTSFIGGLPESAVPKVLHGVAPLTPPQVVWIDRFLSRSCYLVRSARVRSQKVGA